MAYTITNPLHHFRRKASLNIHHIHYNEHVKLILRAKARSNVILNSIQDLDSVNKELYS